MDICAVRGGRSKRTGHYRRSGTRELYCGRPAGTKNGHGATLRGWKMCTRCVSRPGRRNRDRRGATQPGAPGAGGAGLLGGGRRGQREPALGLLPLGAAERVDVE
ncbi:hypothetical protein ACWDAZ_31500, partial [Streptomyces sp. NPDC001215]